MIVNSQTLSSRSLNHTGLKAVSASHIGRLASKGDCIIGETTIDKIRHGARVPIKAYIVKGANFSDYHLIDNKNNKLGFTVLHFYRQGEEKVYGVDYKYERFPGAVYVERMESLCDDCRGIGSVLHEVAVRIARQEGYEGRVLLDAEKSSHIFHYKFGFRSMGEKYYLKDEAIENEIERAQKRVRRGIILSTKEYDTSHLGPISMYLPEDIISEILSKAQIDLYE